MRWEREQWLQRNELARLYHWKRHKRLPPLNVNKKLMQNSRNTQSSVFVAPSCQLLRFGFSSRKEYTWRNNLARASDQRSSLTRTARETRTFIARVPANAESILQVVKNYALVSIYLESLAREVLASLHDPSHPGSLLRRELNYRTRRFTESARARCLLACLAFLFVYGVKRVTPISVCAIRPTHRSHLGSELSTGCCDRNASGGPLPVARVAGEWPFFTFVEKAGRCGRMHFPIVEGSRRT
jgi:hypothetical protein